MKAYLKINETWEDTELTQDVLKEQDIYIGSDVRIGSGAEVGKHITITGGYKYTASSYRDENTGIWYIQLGCFLRSVDEWESNFWNNNNEFPNNGSEDSQARWNTYQSLLTWINQNK